MEFLKVSNKVGASLGVAPRQGKGALGPKADCRSAAKVQ
jgi:hypothetical protein